MKTNNYVYGNNAVTEAPSHATLREIRVAEKKQKKMHMSILYVSFLVVAIAILGFTLINYVKLQAEITAVNDRISVKETTLNDLTLANDDEYSKMVNEIDIDNIRKIAIEELGMVYATEDQVIKYTRENSDYVRQLADIPQ